MKQRILAALLLLGLASFPAAADDDWRKLINPNVLTAGFLESHPDLRWRLRGMKAYNRGAYEMAFEYFRRASRYADKPSQGMIADMYWGGVGVPADRALGYAWMDLAAERLYPQFVLFRERYWAALDDSERADAIARGHAVYAEYGDAVAKPRLERQLRFGLLQMTGSRTGFTGNALTIIPWNGPGDGIPLRADEYYAPKYWKPEKYWELQDKIWHAPERGKVDVGEPMQVRDEVSESMKTRGENSLKAQPVGN